jgi:hypothetical protein
MNYRGHTEHRAHRESKELVVLSGAKDLLLKYVSRQQVLR